MINSFNKAIARHLVGDRFQDQDLTNSYTNVIFFSDGLVKSERGEGQVTDAWHLVKLDEMR